MKFPEKYIKGGKFILHSGQETNVFYDVNALLTDNKEWKKIWIDIPKYKAYYKTYVGIATGGAIIASQFKNWAMIKDGEIKGKIKGECILIDDVCTTEASLREGMKLIKEATGKYPEEVYVVLDRRKGLRGLHVESLYQEY